MVFGLRTPEVVRDTVQCIYLCGCDGRPTYTFNRPDNLEIFETSITQVASRSEDE